MIDLEQLTIADARKIAALFNSLTGNSTAIPESVPSNLGPQQIVVLDRGFVYVGTTKFDGDFIRIENCRNLRIWGTTYGLGQLAESGPTPTTKLDKIGVVVAPRKSLIHLIPCQTSW